MSTKATKATKTTRNFHVPLPEALYNKLMVEANLSKLPATKLARQAIDSWLWHRQKAALHKAIAAYAAQCTGTEADLDEMLEAASIEHLITEEEM